MRKTVEASARPKDVVAAPAPRISALRRSSNERSKGERRASGERQAGGAKKFGAKAAAPKTPLADRSNNRPVGHVKQAWGPTAVAPSPMRVYTEATDYF